MMKLFIVVVFIVVNFLALAIGGAYTSDGNSSDWYQGLNKAHWTPPGWIFGVAWTMIMIFFSFYMAHLYRFGKSRIIIFGLFLLQWVLNVVWNPIFFYFRNVEFGLVVILCLTGIVGVFFFKYYNLLKLSSLFIVPYFLWLIIASSFNYYIYLYN